MDISDSGWVLGFYDARGTVNTYGSVWMDALLFSTVFLPDPVPWVWNQRTNEFHDLAADVVAVGAVAAYPYCVLEDGTVVGYLVLDADGSGLGWDHAFVWHPDHGLVDLGAGIEGDVFLCGISRKGKIILSYNTSSVQAPSSWQRSPDGVVETGLLPGAEAPWYQGPMGPGTTVYLDNVNDLGQVVLNTMLFTPRGATAPGTDVVVQPTPDSTIAFDNILTPGETTVTAYDIDDPLPPSVPADFALSGTGALINISTTATFSGAVELAIHYEQGTMPEGGTREGQIRLLHFVDPQWVDVTDYARPNGFLDKTNNLVYGRVTSFSPFAIVEILDTTPPVIAAMADVHADATSTLGAIVTFTAPTATDDTAGSVAVTCVPASGTLFPVGITTVTCTASDTHQNTASSTFDVIVRIDPRYLKGAVADSLNTLIPTSDKKTVKRLLKAIEEIEDSLAPALWVDDFHLTTKGREVFKDESEAAAQLTAIESPPALVTQALKSLVEADRVLAATALAEAIAANPTSTHLAAATAEMDLAITSSASGAYRDAIRHYRKAWRSSMKALGLL